MKKILISEFGDANKLQLAQVEIPSVAEGKVLVQVDYAGVNFIDTYQRQGVPVYNMVLPFTPGMEGAGVVTEVGIGVSDFKVGDKVAWTAALGSYTQFHLIDATKLVKIPAELDTKIAAAAMLQGLTAQYLSDATFPIKPGDVALVHAAAGGTGYLLCQMILARGGKVIASTSTDEKEKLIKKLGIAHIIRYDKEDILTKVKEFTNGIGVNVVYDGVGQKTFDQSILSLKPRGMMVLYGAASGQVPPFDLQRLNAGGSLYITRPTLFHYISELSEYRRRSEELFKLISSGKLEIRIHHTYDLTDSKKAQEDLASGKTSGKLLIKTS